MTSSRLSELLEKELNITENSSENLLSRALSINSEISTTSSNAIRAQETANNTSLQTFEEIGKGSCGIVFQQVGTLYCVKYSLDSEPAALWNDYLKHALLNTAFADTRRLRMTLKIPRCIGFVGIDEDDWWAENISRFPEEFRQPKPLLMSERILPLPEPIRGALISLYCRFNLQDQARSSPGNKNCLVRVYLGKRRLSDRPGAYFSLKNFKLHLDHMETLQLDTKQFAREMAYGLAVLHWKIKSDARDVEFLLGSEPTDPFLNAASPSFEYLSSLPPGTSTLPTYPGVNGSHRIVQLWLIDFNQCRTIPMTHDGVATAVQAFFTNDPYYPRPSKTNTKDQELWLYFRQQYLEFSNIVAKEPSYSALAQEFINLIETR